MTGEQKTPRTLWQIDLAGCLTCVGVSAVAYILCLGPWLNQRASAQARRIELSEKRQVCSELSQSLAALKQDVIQIRQDLERMEVPLQSTERINQRLAELTDILENCDMKIDAMQTGSVTQGPYCSFVPIHVVGQSEYRNCLKALHQLHQRLPDMVSVGFRLNSTSEALRQYTLDLCWYAAPTVVAARQPSTTLRGGESSYAINQTQ